MIIYAYPSTIFNFKIYFLLFVKLIETILSFMQVPEVVRVVSKGDKHFNFYA